MKSCLEKVLKTNLKYLSTLRAEISYMYAPTKNIFRGDIRGLCSQGTQGTNKFGFFLRDYTVHDQFFILNLPELIDISNIFALLAFENRRLQRSFQKIFIGNLPQQDKTRAVRIKWKLECVLY